MMILLLSLVSCKGAEDEKEEETQAQTTSAEETAVKQEEEKKVDFSSLSVSSHIIMNIGDEEELAGSVASSKSSVASVLDDGKVKAHKEGVSLIAVEKDDETTLTVCCVLEKGQREDRSAGEPQLFESGKTFFHTAPIGGGEYISSNSDIVNVDGAPTLSFGNCGYAVVTVANASRPFFYSFIVYDRAVEE